MTTLMQASAQWRTRPADERYTSLIDMRDYKRRLFENSRSRVVSSRALEFAPGEGGHHSLVVLSKETGKVAAPTHWSFGQLCSLASPGASPAEYFRKSSMPAAIIADALNFNMKFSRGPEEIGVLATRTDDGAAELRAATGPRYGRIWDYHLVHHLVDKFGSGVPGESDWCIPGEFGVAVTPTKENTTLFASDRNMFVFLADEKNRIEIPNRRAGKFGSFARGFFAWNSEVGDATLGFGFFLFDFACCNRIVWGADQYTELRIRHTATAPDRWLEELQPALVEYANGSSAPVVKAIMGAREKRIDQDVSEFLGNRFGKKLAPVIMAAHEADEGRPIETLWDASVGATAYARTINHTDRRVEVEREAGKLLKLAA
jgi:hypothetical protein